MKLRKWAPGFEFDDLFPRFGSLLDWEGPLAGQESLWQPRTDISETEEAYKLNIELPEVSKEDINLSIENKVLTLSGERKSQIEDDKHHLRERYYGQFKRSFALPINVIESEISARFSDGMLYLTIPKAKEEQCQSRSIDIH